MKKMENDKYFIAIQKQHFKQLEEDKFSLLEEVKSVNIGNNVPVTLSIGLGLSAESYSQSYNYARVSIDLALARGGDQAVIKDCSRDHVLWRQAGADFQEYPCEGPGKGGGSAGVPDGKRQDLCNGT